MFSVFCEKKRLIQEGFVFFFDVKELLEVQFTASDYLSPIVEELKESFVNALRNFEVVFIVMPNWRSFEGILLEFGLSDFLSNSHAYCYMVFAAGPSFSPNGGLLKSKGNIVKREGFKYRSEDDETMFFLHFLM